MSPATQVAVASCREAIERFPDEDEPFLLEALRRRGLEVGVWAWDDPGAPWSTQDLVLVRSTWDYPGRRDELLAWAERVEAETDLANEAATLRWNTHKRYLAELAEAGIPVVPTRFLSPGDPIDLGPADEEVVVKPAVSGGSQDTARYPADRRADAEQHASALLAAGRDVLVQPYLAAVDEVGETAVVHLDGTYSHGLRKGPLLRPGAAPVDGLFAAEQMSVREPSPDERRLAETVLEALPVPPPLYARVDLLPGPDGRPVVLEVEVTEPSLFFAHVPAAAERLADAVLARLAR